MHGCERDADLCTLSIDGDVNRLTRRVLNPPSGRTLRRRAIQLHDTSMK
jgi:hypothetical protein